MRILQNLTQKELDYYMAQPTAKALHERIMKDSVYIAEGDKTAAALYVAEREAKKSSLQKDKAEISRQGLELNRAENIKTKSDNAKASISFNLYNRDNGNVTVGFDNSAMIHRAVKQGFIEIDGKKIELTDDVKKKLVSVNKEIQNVKKSVFLHNRMLHEATNARQTNDAMKAANDKMSRAMKTASRIMHGRKVSPADEKELMEFNPDLYSMAKSAEALEKHRNRKDDREDEKLSAANDEARKTEAEPKDYSVEEIPMPQTEAQIDISFDGDTPQVIAVGTGV
ncbi:MAG: hypothetical protein IKN43_02395 [Selenomonadaceae bacterium]|nr:hypothetical protein [Selenomonadaceae bacterium]